MNHDEEREREAGPALPATTRHPSAALSLGWRTRASRAVLKALRFEVVGTPPTEHAYVVVAAPHTSNWDFPAMIAVAWASGVSPVWLGKRELFDGPLGGLFRRLGGVAIDRKNPEGVVDEMADLVREHGTIALAIPAEGTRSKGHYWKSGFHRIAREARVPVVLTFLDGPGRRGGWGPVYVPAVDPNADMPMIRAFYADKPGLRPEHRTAPRLRSEPDAGSHPEA